MLLVEEAFLTTPQCSPSRISILTGTYPHATGAEDLHMPLPEGQRIVPGRLSEAGYFTGMMRKRHLGENGNEQFDWYSEDLRDFGDFLEESGAQPFFMWVGFNDPHRPYDAGIRTPLIFAWPAQIEAGSRTEALADQRDRPGPDVSGAGRPGAAGADAGEEPAGASGRSWCL